MRGAFVDDGHADGVAGRLLAGVLATGINLADEVGGFGWCFVCVGLFGA